MPATIFVTAIALFLFSASPAYADGGGPILLLVNFYAFSFGQVWIMLSEFIYLKLLLKKESPLAIGRTVVVMNVISALLGALLLSFLLAAGGYFGGRFLYSINQKSYADYLIAIGTWVVGDNSPHPEIAVTSSIIGFIATYFITVYIENRYLKRRNARSSFPPVKLLHVFALNAVSYTGLASIFFLSI